MDEAELLSQYDAQQDWSQARLAALVQSVVCYFKRCHVELISFDDVKRKLRLNQKVYRGVQEIELGRIRGSVGRYRDFTSAFLPRSGHLEKRWERVRAASHNKELPPIEVYQVGDAYFVLDGNHRVSVARQENRKTIEAHVWEFATPVALSAEADLDEVLIAAEHADFLRSTRLEKLRPNARIEFSCPGCYGELEAMIAVFHDSLEKERGHIVPDQEALLEWYDNVYRPCVKEIKESDVLKRFPRRTAADLCVWLWKHEKSLGEQQAPGTKMGT